MKNICIFSGYFLPHLGGVEKYTNNMANELIKLGYNVTIVTSNYGKQKYNEKKNNIEIIRMPVINIIKSRFPLPRIFNKNFREINKKLKNSNFDIILINTRFYYTSILGAQIAKKNKIQSYVIEHGSGYLTLNNKIVDFFIKIYENLITLYLKKICSGFVGASEAGNRWLKNFGINSLDTWNNAIVFDEKYNIKNKSSEKTIFSFAGRVIKQKGILNILKAFEKLESKYDNIELHIAGNGELLESLKKKYKSKNIYFYGKIDSEKVYDILKKSHVLLMPSTHPEGLSYTLLEAGLFKNAAIATNIGSFKDVIKNKKNGILINTSYNDLYVAMKKMITNVNLRDKISKNLYNDIINNYTWEKTGIKISKFIKERENV